ncbi:hypothetical protein TL16_g06704 [Triparma laevis f. inornata]|uniref:Uncharacterized protein n=2 Tax=Triparma laevis TaxID=1534972 RepID=A0A9W6ZHQ1_9STRA|nr:hypothetical protein TrLO_g7235 [Triparma laevis f. longispina]GMH75269.1 hypothetical protein TL16_g06704 [Triparma laevis f. inornata]
MRHCHSRPSNLSFLTSHSLPSTLFPSICSLQSYQTSLPPPPTPLPSRTILLNLVSSIGLLSSSLAPIPPSPSHILHLQTIFSTLITLSTTCNISITSAIQKKIILNAKKYPAKLCKGKSGKYTSYSEETGVTSNIETQSYYKENVYTVNPDITFSDLEAKITEFVTTREWSKFHTPRNVALAMVGELGELCEIFQWFGDSGKPLLLLLINASTCVEARRVMR